MDFDHFLRLYPMRAPRVMWLLGAGASASAGVPTASDLVWEFKKRIYCSKERIPLTACSDLGDNAVRRTLQCFFDGQGLYPREGDDEEYAALFEAAFPDEADRRRFIEELVRGAIPSYGHLALAALLKLAKAQIVWTTNFDGAVEDAVARVFGSTTALTVADLDRGTVAAEAISESRWPILAKLHGDFRSRRLKNVPDELREQDRAIRRALVMACRQAGLAVIGYSGRDESVMDALEEAIDGGLGYPLGLFWFRRPGESVSPRAERLVEAARLVSVSAEFVEVATFDEAMGDILGQVGSLPPDIDGALRSARPRATSAPVAAPGRGWPVIRLNAIPVLAYPTACRLVDCEIGGLAELRDAIEKAGVEVIAGKRRFGVLAFGSDRDVRQALEPFGIRRFDLHAIETRRMRYDSPETRLLTEALVRGFTRTLPFTSRRSRRFGWELIVDPTRDGDAALDALRSAAGVLVGQIPRTALRWSECARVRFDWVGERLWLTLLPSVSCDSIPANLSERERASLRTARSEFVRARMAGRYNAATNALLTAWVEILTGGEDREVRALGISDGVDAAFTVGPITAFSRRRHES